MEDVVVTAEIGDLFGDRDFGTEFLRLVEGARRQRNAGDAGRETEIVLDARRGAGLTSEGTTIDQDDTEAFGRGIHSGAQSGWARADDRHIVQLQRVELADHAETARELILAGIAQQLAVGAKNDRQLLLLDVKAVEQRPRLGVDVGTKDCVGMAVAVQEVGESRMTSAFISATDDDRAAGAVSISLTRRRMSARMMRSPRSASSTSRSRRRCGRMTTASTALSALASTSAGRPVSCASSPMKARNRA